MNIFNLPDLGEGLAEAEIRTWHVHEGDTVAADQPMVSVETAKAVVEVPAPHAGKIAKLYGKAGDIIQTHAPLVGFEAEACEKQGGRQDSGSVVGALPEGNVVLDEPVAIESAAHASPALKAMPAVRALARELGVDLHRVKTASPGGQITAKDVMAVVNQESVANAEQLTGVRRSMAQTMTQSRREVVPATLMEDADITDAPEDFTVHLLQAMVHAAGQEGALNATFESEKELRVLHHEVHVGLAIDSPAGLFVPVIKNTEKKSPAELRTIIHHFREALQKRSLKPAELTGATIMLSNFGTIAGRYACPVIVPPLVAILACGKIRDAVVVREGKMVIRRMAPLSVTFDHRAVTGGEASRWLSAVIQYLEGKVV